MSVPVPGSLRPGWGSVPGGESGKTRGEDDRSLRGNAFFLFRNGRERGSAAPRSAFVIEDRMLCIRANEIKITNAGPSPDINERRFN